jgi:hypothetical protein
VASFYAADAIKLHHHQFEEASLLSFPSMTYKMISLIYPAQRLVPLLNGASAGNLTAQMKKLSTIRNHKNVGMKTFPFEASLCNSDCTELNNKIYYTQWVLMGFYYFLPLMVMLCASCFVAREDGHDQYRTEV